MKPLWTHDVLVVVLLARPPHRRHRRHGRCLHCGLNRRRHSDLAASHAHPRREVKLVGDACAVEELLRGLAPWLSFSDVMRFIGSKFHLESSFQSLAEPVSLVKFGATTCHKDFVMLSDNSPFLRWKHGDCKNSTMAYRTLKNIL